MMSLTTALPYSCPCTTGLSKLVACVYRDSPLVLLSRPHPFPQYTPPPWGWRHNPAWTIRKLHVTSPHNAQVIQGGWAHFENFDKRNGWFNSVTMPPSVIIMWVNGLWSYSIGHTSIGHTNGRSILCFLVLFLADKRSVGHAPRTGQSLLIHSPCLLCRPNVFSPRL